MMRTLIRTVFFVALALSNRLSLAQGGYFYGAPSYSPSTSPSPLATPSSPVNLLTVAGTALAPPTPYGRAPIGGMVLAVNAYITNLVPVVLWASGQQITATNGSLNVVCTSGCSGSGGSGSNAAAGSTGSAVPSSADYVGFNVSGNLVGVSSSNPLPITGSISNTGFNVNNFPGTQTVTQSAGSNLHIDVDNLPATQQVSLVAPSTGQTNAANSLPVTLANDKPVQVAVPSLPPVQIANSPLRPVPVYDEAGLQVYALINGALVPVLLMQGQAAMAQSLPVVIASNQSAIPVTGMQVGLGPNVNAAPASTQVATDANGVQLVRVVGGLPLPSCNSVRTTNCQHF